MTISHSIGAPHARPVSHHSAVSAPPHQPARAAIAAATAASSVLIPSLFGSFTPITAASSVNRALLLVVLPGHADVGLVQLANPLHRATLTATGDRDRLEKQIPGVPPTDLEQFSDIRVVVPILTLMSLINVPPQKTPHLLGLTGN